MQNARSGTKGIGDKMGQALLVKKNNTLDNATLDIDESHVHAELLTNVGFEVDGRLVTVEQGTHVLVNVERETACLDNGVHFSIFAGEYKVIRMN